MEGETAYATAVDHPESPRKRSFDAFADRPPRPAPPIITGPTSPQSTSSPQSVQQPMLPNGASREPSPALSTTSSLTSLGTVQAPFGLDGTAQSTPSPNTALTGAPPAKRRKLTPGEKLQRLQEKAEKERQRAEAQAKKEEEKQQKDDERRQKAESKEEKKREREIERQRREQEKEDEKRQREEEREKKEKAQSRINNFFVKPAAPRTLSTPLFRPPAHSESTHASVEDKDHVPHVSDYERTFLPFSQPSNSRYAPIIRFTWDEQACGHLLSTFDDLVQNTQVRPHAALRDYLSPLPWETSSSRPAKQTVKALVTQVLEPAAPDAANAGPISAFGNPTADLHNITVKFLYFHEDIRPPFIGSYTKHTTEQAAKKVARNPFSKVRTDTDYDYDSEAEWEEPEEGEDIESDGESDTESVDTTEDMAGFLDDEDTLDGPNRKLIPLDMKPISSGVHWENEEGKYQSPDAAHLRSFKLLVINDSLHKLPIDPFSTAYWAEASGHALSASASRDLDCDASARMPLQPRLDVSNGSLGIQIAEAGKVKAFKVSKGPPRLLTGTDLNIFKDHVRDSVHNKLGLLNILKKEVFPKIPNAVLKDTLETIAVRHGRTEAEKRWIILGDAAAQGVGATSIHNT